MKRIIVLTSLILLIIFICGCTQSVTCNAPYIVHGTSCCLDQNNNKICDSDETPQTTNTPSETPTQTTPQQQNLCAGITCSDYCSGATRYYNGQCSSGQCSYASTQCQNGCQNGQCITYQIGNGICETGEQNAPSGMGCIDCASVCPDHTYMCVGTSTGGMMGQPTSVQDSCQRTSVLLDSRGFYVASNWQSQVSTLGTNEFKSSTNQALISMMVSMDFPSSSSAWKANKWETYLTNIQSQVTCYKTDGSYALGNGESYNGLSLKNSFFCTNEVPEQSCEPIGSDLQTVTKLGTLSTSYTYSKFTVYSALFYSQSGISGKPLSLNCKVKIWSGDIPSDIKEASFTIHFV